MEGYSCCNTVVAARRNRYAAGAVNSSAVVSHLPGSTELSQCVLDNGGSDSMTSPDAPAEGRRQDADGHTVHEESPTQSSSRPGPAAFQAEINHRRQALVGLRAKGTLEDHFGMSSNENIDGRHHHSMSSLMKSDVQYEDYWKYVLTDLQLGKKSRIAVEVRACITAKLELHIELASWGLHCLDHLILSPRTMTGMQFQFPVVLLKTQK